MKAQVISSNHTIMIDGFQVDLWYNFERSWLEIFVDGKLKVSSNFSPSHKTFNYINLIEVATTILQQHKKKLALQAQEQEENEQPVVFE
jgi:hypothetical protein